MKKMKHVTPVRAIREKCLDCSAGSPAEVRMCTVGPEAKNPCPLFPYRLGKNPGAKRNLSPEARGRQAENLKIARAQIGKKQKDH